MISLKGRLILLLILSTILGSCKESSENIRKVKIDNLIAFSRLYGYIRYFHPSDEAANTDWDKFTVYGVQKVQEATNPKELKQILKKIFTPIAPTLKLENQANKLQFQIKELTPPDLTNYKSICWQHSGIGLTKPSIYHSSRLNRLKHGENFAYNEVRIQRFISKEEIEKLKGNRLKSKVSVKNSLTPEKSVAHLFYLVVFKNQLRRRPQHFHSSPITNSDWGEQEFILRVPEDTRELYYGIYMKHGGKIFIDDFQLLQQKDEKWKPLKIPNGGFEEETIGQSPKSWATGGKLSHFNIEVSDKNSLSGKKSLLIESKGQIIPGQIFPQKTEPGDYVKRELGKELHCLVPIALYGNRSQTYPAGNKKLLKKLKEDIEKALPVILNNYEPDVRIANTIIAWNVFQHFYPYFDVVDVNWQKVLPTTLKEVFDNKSSMDFYWTISKMVAQLQDGHGYISYKNFSQQGGIPAKFEFRENKVVVVASKDKTFKKGDVIVSIDNVPAVEILEEKEKYISGSPLRKRYRSLMRFGEGPPDSVVEIEIKRLGKNHSLKYRRVENGFVPFGRQMGEFTFSPIKEIKDGIYYINERLVKRKDFMKLIDKLAEAKGVIFDYRYDGQSIKDKDGESLHTLRDVLPHLTSKEVSSTNWQIPEIIYPDQNKVNFNKSNWKLGPEKPLFKGKVVFINTPARMSVKETEMGIVKHHNLGKLVGTRSAGCNGNINRINLAGGFQIIWTGMKVLKHDGAQLHLVGIEPDYPVEKSLKAVIEGQDEYLKKAIELIEQAAGN